MRILVVGPTHAEGSLPPYLDALTDGLVGAGAEVDRLGAAFIPVDEETRTYWSASRIESAARELLAGVDLDSYDVVSLHFGNDEIEQLLPSIWSALPHPPVVYHVHNVDWLLFSDSVPDPARYAAVRCGVEAADGFIHFSSYSLPAFESLDVPSKVSFSPTTIKPLVETRELEDVIGEINWRRPADPLITMIGFASPWKNVPDLLKALTTLTMPIRLLVAGIGWTDPDRVGLDLSNAVLPNLIDAGRAQVGIHAQFVGSAEKRSLIDASAFGIFPYQPFKTFQGSGAVTDYIANRVPVVATDIGSFRELVGPFGMIVPDCDVASLTGAIEAMIERGRAAFGNEPHLIEHSSRFLPATHAAECLDFYSRIVEQKRSAIA